MGCPDVSMITLRCPFHFAYTCRSEIETAKRIETLKIGQRTSLRQKRKALSLAQREDQSARMSGHLYRWLIDADWPAAHNIKETVLAGYWAVGSECSVRELIKLWPGPCVFPCVEAPCETLRFRAGPKKTASFCGIPQPARSEPELAPEIVLVPLLGYTRDGGRLGQGGGWYDRTLQHIRRERSLLTIGIGFSCQELQGLVLESHDQRMDAIANENEVIVCKSE